MINYFVFACSGSDGDVDVFGQMNRQTRLPRDVRVRRAVKSCRMMLKTALFTAFNYRPLAGLDYRRLAVVFLGII